MELIAKMSKETHDRLTEKELAREARKAKRAGLLPKNKILWAVRVEDIYTIAEESGKKLTREQIKGIAMEIQGIDFASFHDIIADLVDEA